MTRKSRDFVFRWNSPASLASRLDVKNIEEEFQFHGLQASKSPPEYWRNLGSSKTRTKEQEIKDRDLILQKITETTKIQQ